MVCVFIVDFMHKLCQTMNIHARSVLWLLNSMLTFLELNVITVYFRFGKSYSPMNKCKIKRSFSSNINNCQKVFHVQTDRYLMPKCNFLFDTSLPYLQHSICKKRSLFSLAQGSMNRLGDIRDIHCLLGGLQPDYQE